MSRFCNCQSKMLEASITSPCGASLGMLVSHLSWDVKRMERLECMGMGTYLQVLKSVIGERDMRWFKIV